MTHCLLFDSDGTLVDSESLNAEALADELRVHGIDEQTDALLLHYRGWQFKALLDDLGKRYGLALDTGFEAAFRARASGYFDARLEPIGNIHSALKQLNHAKCVASNAPMSKLRQVLIKTDLLGHFNGQLFSAYDISCFKPDPGLFLHAARQMGFTTDKCIVIEDSDVGIAAARQAGMKCIHYSPHGKSDTFSDRVITDDATVLTITDMLQLPAAISEFEARG